MVLKNLDKHPRQVTFLANSGRFNLPFSNALEAAIFDIDIILVPNPSPTIPVCSVFLITANEGGNPEGARVL